MARNKQAYIVTENRKARFNYEIEESYEAGIVLLGSEVKSIRAGGTNIADAFAEVKDGEAFLVNCHIPEYKMSGVFGHYSKRIRKLLLHKKQIRKITGRLKVKGISLVPLKMYFTEKGLLKIDLAIVKGKKEYEKRDTIQEREWQRDQQRIFKDKW